MTRTADPLLWKCIAGWLIACIALSQSNVLADADDPPILYSKSTPHDPITDLQSKIDKGQVSLTWNVEHGYLESLLKTLAVPQSSQGLVFSKTSFQRNLISPYRPRAIFFNDDTYVGYVRGAPMLEFATMDRKLGTVFYILKQRETQKPKFLRATAECTQCHESAMTRNIPGLIMRSVYSDLEGQPILTAGTFVSTDQSPLSERWGGWYVTGNCGSQHHMGNVTCDDEDHPEKADFRKNASIPSLAKLVNTEPYVRSTSDVVALMVLAHQTHLHNLITSANYEVRMALRDSDAINAALHLPLSQRSESTRHRIRSACEPLVRGLLFSGESPLADAVSGTSGFTEEFSSRGPCDGQGRSLRQFDLKHRLFKYPCSYLIYSDQFDGLPGDAKNYVYRRMWEVLTGRDDSRCFDHLTDADRTAIIEILLATKKDLPAQWARTGHRLSLSH